MSATCRVMRSNGMSGKKKLKQLPPLLSDEEAEKFTEEADLSDYDLSGFKPRPVRVSE